MVAFGKLAIGYEAGSYRRRRAHHGFVHRWKVPNPGGDIRGWAVWNIYGIRFPVWPRHRIRVRYVKVPR